MTPDSPDSVRLDRWLWAARFYRTRSAATRAAAGGKVELNGQRPRPASAVRIGDEVAITKAPYETRIVVRGLAERRGSAADAAGLYEETAASRRRRERLARQMRVHRVPRYEGKGRPTKKERREIERLRPDWPGDD